MAIRNQIFIGSLSDPDYYFDNESIDEAGIVQNVALVGQEMSVDSFTALVRDDENNLRDVVILRSSDGKEIEDAVGQILAVDVSDELAVSDLIRLENGTPVWFYQDDILVGKFYVKSVERKGKNLYQLNTVSAIGMLDEMDHGGGLFLPSTFGAVLQHILAAGLHGTGSPVIDYAIDEDVAAQPVSGWLPHDTKRNNLYRLVFANGVNIVKNIDGNPRFTFIYSAPDAAEDIGEEPIYNHGDVEYAKPYTRVVVYEHTFTDVQDENPAVLFDNTEGTTIAGAEIWFSNAPVIVDTLAATEGLTIVSATENSAVLRGNGKLTGIPYLHTTKEVAYGDPAASDEKTIQVKNEPLVNMINSANLINRLYAFYCPDEFIQKINNGILYQGQRCGKVYRFKDPFGTQVTAYLSSMEINASAVNKADCTFYANYTPAGKDGLLQCEEVIVPKPDPEDPSQQITEGDWEVPPGVTSFKVVLIGGGTGGTSGWPGKNGKDAYTHTGVSTTDDLSGVWYGAEGGDGGEGGSGGTPGRVKVVMVESAVPGTVYHWTLGLGGEGGAHTGFIPDTVDELRAALKNEDPDTEYTTEELEEMVAEEQSLSGWTGSPNLGSAGTATTFGIEGVEVWSTDDSDAYVPQGGVYDPIGENYYALTGHRSIQGGKGGARKVQSGGTFNWVTDGEDVTGPYYHIEGEAELPEGETAPTSRVYSGGSTGNILTSVSGLSEAVIKAYGGNGAGAAVGLDARAVDEETGLPIYEHMHGASNQSTEWWVSWNG
ncbi:MAG: hypothetical protein K6C12_03265 [Oscillospiraceae bacterium]|nr:hypothetical protein [Oscillospiraceae bacterium]